MLVEVELWRVLIGQCLDISGALIESPYIIQLDRQTRKTTRFTGAKTLFVMVDSTEKIQEISEDNNIRQTSKHTNAVGEENFSLHLLSVL